MKLKELLTETTDFINKEMPLNTSASINFYSEDTINREFDIIDKIKINDITYWIVLKKNKSFAVIGKMDKRNSDGKVGIQMVGVLEFKDKPDFAFNRLIDVDENVLQVDSVEVYDKVKFNGLGFNLYLSLAKYGYIIVSDHSQYRGGKKLWEKLSKLSTANNYSVYIIDNGHPVLDDKGEILKYDGTNLADDKIWAVPTTNIANSKHYVLIVLKKHK